MLDQKFYSILASFILVISSCNKPFDKEEITLVLTGSVHGQLDPCG